MSSSKWQITFRSGVEKRVSDQTAKEIDRLYERYKATKEAASVKFPDGTRVSIADLESILPVETTAFAAQSQETFGKIAGYIAAATSDNETEQGRIAQWKAIIRENQARSRTGLPWLYHEQTPDGQIVPSTKERMAVKVEAYKAQQYERLTTN